MYHQPRKRPRTSHPQGQCTHRRSAQSYKVRRRPVQFLGWCPPFLGLVARQFLGWSPRRGVYAQSFTLVPFCLISRFPVSQEIPRRTRFLAYYALGAPAETPCCGVERRAQLHLTERSIAGTGTRDHRSRCGFPFPDSSESLTTRPRPGSYRHNPSQHVRPPTTNFQRHGCPHP